MIHMERRGSLELRQTPSDLGVRYLTPEPGQLFHLDDFRVPAKRGAKLRNI